MRRCWTETDGRLKGVGWCGYFGMDVVYYSSEGCGGEMVAMVQVSGMSRSGVLAVLLDVCGRRWFAAFYICAVSTCDAVRTLVLRFGVGEGDGELPVGIRGRPSRRAVEPASLGFVELSNRPVCLRTPLGMDLELLVSDPSSGPVLGLGDERARDSIKL